MNLTTYGRLGNILFELAHALSENKGDLNVNVFRYEPPYQKEYLKNICKNINKIAPKLNMSYSGRDRNFKGYFQSEKYFDVDYIRSIFYIHPRNIEYYKKTYFQIDFDNCVGISVRRGDYINKPPFQVLSSEYFKNIYNLFFEGKQCIIFSDDIEWCKQNFHFKNQIFMQNNNDIFIDLILFSLCKNHICSPSTFSWWGCWLNEQTGAINVFPNTWFQKNIELNSERQDIEKNIIPNRWKKEQLTYSVTNIQNSLSENKKRLLLIGNKLIDKNISEIVNTQFDKVFRINRMNNFHYTGEKLNYLFISQTVDFFEYHKGGVFKEYYKNAEQVYGNKDLCYRNNQLKPLLTQKQYENLIMLDVASTAKNISDGKPWPTTTIEVLDYILNSEQFKDYEIWITCIDIEGRGKMFHEQPQWKNSCHKNIGIYEENYLKKKIAEGKIKVLT